MKHILDLLFSITKSLKFANIFYCCCLFLFCFLILCGGAFAFMQRSENNLWKLDLYLYESWTLRLSHQAQQKAPLPIKSPKQSNFYFSNEWIIDFILGWGGSRKDTKLNYLLFGGDLILWYHTMLSDICFVLHESSYSLTLYE